ncbi:MAG TPA: type II toxin-antitoxin system RelE/ParE family toxin [Mycobacteriales bacterium]|jgi:mRNA interferase RelE/StbE|nr:type II toxin-antitoxin system RelE/ParE family toxin [Mycobacteriales bacterium]
MAYKVELVEEMQRDLAKLDRQVARRILTFLNERVATLDDPRSLGEPLKGSRLGDLWKYRVGDWRVIAEIQDESVCVLILQIGHRREIYRPR